MNSLNGEKIEKIITSLLSSPCNYTPLLHFVIPVEYQGMKAFSELWIDPKDEGGDGEPGSREGGHVHVLITFDVPGVGQMEAEFMMAGREPRIPSVLSGILYSVYLKAWFRSSAISWRNTDTRRQA